MNIILVLVDSLNKDCLPIYNPDTVCKTPSLRAFAGKSFIFDNHFVGSLPCMPARREIFAGRKEFLWRPWGPLELFDPRLARLVQEQGYNTAIITDHYHYWEENANGYIESFMSSELIRGHESDNYKLRSKGPCPRWVEKMAEFRATEHMYQYYENVRNFQREEDFFPAKVFSAAADWLENYAGRGPFFLQVESFDVHEPFHVPEPYASMYSDGGSAERYNIWPPYQVYDDHAAFMAQTTPQELAFLRAQYLGKVTMVDRWLGVLMAKIDALSLWDDTLVIVTTDHGHDLGERGVFGKQYPHYDSHANIPMLIFHPRHEGGVRVNALTQTVDLFATVLDAAQAELPRENRHSISILPAIESPGATIREVVSYGTFGQGVCLSDGEWTLFRSPIPGKTLYTYSTMITRPLIVDNPVDGREGRIPAIPIDQGRFDATIPYPLWQIPITIDPRSDQNFLFNRMQDPGQNTNLWREAPQQRDAMLSRLRATLDQEGCPSEQLERLGLDDIAPSESNKQ